MNNNYVLVVGPSIKTRGGITSVINAYKSSCLWEKWNCLWIETHIDRSVFYKVYYFLFGLIRYVFYLPKAKLVHIHFSSGISLFRKFFFVFIAKIMSVPVVAHFHAHSLDNTIKGKKKNFYKKMFVWSKVVIVLSEYWKFHLHSLTGDSVNIVVVHNPCPKILLKQLRKQKYVLYAGTLNSRKGYKDLIESFAMIAGVHNDWKLVFAGNGELEKAKEYAKKYGVYDQVVFLGWVSGEKKNYYFESAEIFCLPSYAEGFPMAVLDAFAFELPVLTTAVGGIDDILQHGINAMIFDPGDKQTLSRYLEMMISDGALRKRLSNESKNMSQNKFSLRFIATQVDKIYAEIS